MSVIASNKHPGVQPIGICETVRCVISKAIFSLILTQLSAGQTAGIKAAISATYLCFSSPATEGILLVDASRTPALSYSTLVADDVAALGYPSWL